ncbi:hypothetical protein AAFP32_01365 [Brevibacterium sp. CBA3109]|uniref:Uncharacterized protein n=1 Tax=Brevibacterium koreense TaxID=3140787 RepID=A0AAU7ULP5_9MICO
MARFFGGAGVAEVVVGAVWTGVPARINSANPVKTLSIRAEYWVTSPPASPVSVVW